MHSPFDAALQRARLIGTKFFYRFGIHCATHQTRLILVSSVVITSLLFPAIASYYSSQTQYFAGFTLRVLDAFLTPDDISTYFAQHDLRHLWEGDAWLRVREDSVARARCGSEGLLREERVLVGSVSPEDGLGALDISTLLSSFNLERRIADSLATRNVPCLKVPGGSCFSLGPSVFWGHDSVALRSDENILETINNSPNISIAGIPVTPEMVLTGRERVNPTSTYADSATFLVLTYFFHDKDCFGHDGHFQWLHALEDAVESENAGELVVLAQRPQLVALEFRNNASLKSNLSMLSAFTYVTYTVFGIYCFLLFRRMDMVHSRIGLAFTGLVEIVVSTITSVSVCALVGFRVTMVPLELFPIILVFIGVENMSSIVDAVVKTSISLPVKERIAQGLSYAGTSNTLKVVSYNAVLGVIAVFSTGAIRQFCAFSIVVLVAHWFLVHTFFVTVLDELLRQNANLTPSVIADPRKSTASLKKTKLGSTWDRLQDAMHGRPAKNISFFLLLAITAALYYTTYSPTGGNAHAVKTPARNPLAQLSQARNITPDSVSPAERLWKVINPTSGSLVHIRIESPTILLLGGTNTEALDDISAESDKPSRPRLPRIWSRTMRQLEWLLKIFVVPITATTMTLYGLLLYLLKDAELLEAQRQAPEPESPSDELSAVEGSISFSTLPRVFATDVELIATSEDGKVIATVGLQNELVIWRTETQSHVSVDTSNFVLGGTSIPSTANAITAIAMNPLGNVCAVGTGSGTVAVFLIGVGRIKPLPHFQLEHLTSGVTSLYFTGTLKFASGAITPLRATTESPTALTCRLYTAYENGAIVEWDVLSFNSGRYVTPSRAASVIKSMLLPIQGDGRLLVAFSLDDGVLEICNVEQANPVLKGECAINAGNPSDLVSKAHACLVELDGAKRVIVGAASQAGVISLWEASTVECLFILDEPFGDINLLRLSPVQVSECTTCGELPVENFSITFSVGHVVQFYRAYLTLPTRRCACPRNIPQQAPRSSLLTSSIRPRSSSNASAGSTGANTPVRIRSRRPSLSSSSPSTFPVSGHGVHSRRASEKDTIRRASESFLLSNPDYYEYDAPIGPQDVTPASSFLAAHAQPSIWQSLVVVRVAETTVERGAWDVGLDKIVGIRRRPRPALTKRTSSDLHAQAQLAADQPGGLTPAALDRWELWTFDPLERKVVPAPLLALSHAPPSPKRRRQESVAAGSGSWGRAGAPAAAKRRTAVPRLHFTRVSPFVCTPSCCLGGFGNTVGMFRFTIPPRVGGLAAPSSPPRPSKDGRKD
ncbi:sterol-sensing domain of SREBP cleavage-activation-domain-containing protein [Epithele typhae]|uniref:sterol-sensing domain of SREBP cleavage-activation-domain-containing protein n=1 Tax=Epithele typhae TaxID=378194 RepID=UPI00200741F5|nr:sterol-sensing domain of SREBP cleavage-activation-domain-containing protein [Epithele typhae]KAH9915783.1 sterol-sensing domain of SREBP cleavage-activation-domain-containing protein [Epithele typhae]